MLPFLKSSSKTTDRGRASRWHVNFRDFSKLPDTKVVRTSFFFNVLAVVVALGCALAVANREYRLADLRGQIAGCEKQINHDQKDSAKAIALYRRFEEEERKFNELATFMKANKLVFSDYMMHIGQTLPKGIVLAAIEYKATGVTMRGFVQGSSAQASGIASQYEKQLNQDKTVNTCFESISLPALPTRDAQTGKLSFEISLRFPQDLKGGKRP